MLGSYLEVHSNKVKQMSWKADGCQCSLTRPSAERLELGLSSGGYAAVAPLLGLLLLLSSDGGGVDPLFLFWCHLQNNFK